MYRVNFFKKTRTGVLISTVACSLGVVGLFLFNNNQNYLESEVAWQYPKGYKDDTAFLYKIILQDKDVFIATDRKIEEDFINKSKVNITLLSNSGFFNPAVCAKMPSLFIKNTLLFRGYTTEDGVIKKDIFYQFNLSTNKLEAYTPSKKVLGDIYSFEENLFFFSYINNTLYESDFSEDLTNITYTKIKDRNQFSEKEMNFNMHRPEFNLISDDGLYITYVYDYSGKSFKQEALGEPLSDVTSIENKLLVPIQNSNYKAVFSKDSSSKDFFIVDGNSTLFSYSGAANLYVISTN